jgi:hypothetical protein
VCLFTFLFVLCTAAQQTSLADPFSVVPGDKREQLRADVQRAVDLQKHRKWKDFERVYDRDYPLLNHKAVPQYDLSSTPHIVEFEPMKVVWEPKAQSWMIDGCVAYDDSNSNSGLGWVGGMTVRYVNGEARFLPIMLSTVKDQGFKRCRFVRHR